MIQVIILAAAASNFTEEPWFPGFVTGSLALLAVLAGGVIQTVRERRRDAAAVATAIKTPEPPTTQQVWERLDRTEKALSAAIVLLGEVADQWQGEHPPILSKRHVAILVTAGYMPPEWEPVTED